MKKIIETPTLRTERLVLKPFDLEDAPILQKYFNNWNIIKHLNDQVPWPYPEDGVYSFFKNEAIPRIQKGHTLFWTITLSDKPIGIIEYRVVKEDKNPEDRGFWLAEPYWGQGLMTEASEAVNDFIFFDLKVEKMILDNFKNNIRSRRIKEKNGATYLETIKRAHRGGEIEIEMWELTAEKWKEFRQKS